MRFYQVLVVVVVVAFALSEGADVQPSCGRVPRNVGGQDIPPGRWPWFVSFFIKGIHMCSGSLISDQWVLTEVTCFDGTKLTDVSAFLGRVNQTTSEPKEVLRGVIQTACHPLYDMASSKNDICLVKLSSPVDFSDHISPVCLAAENSTLPNGTFAWIAAPLFRRTELTELQLQILGRNECHSQSLGFISDDFVCTSKYKSEENPCLKPNGAALMVPNDDLIWIQVGVPNIGKICRKSNFISVSARVTYHLEWIRNNTGSSQIGFVRFPSSGVSTSTSSPLRRNTTPTVISPTTRDTGIYTTPTVISPTTRDTGVFGNSEKLHSTFFTSVFALLFSLIVLLV